MCVFFSAKDAVMAAAAIRSALDEQEWITGTDKPAIAAAIHTGRLTRVVGGQLGSPAPRVIDLCETAEPGQLLVSHSTQALLEGELLDGLELVDLGERELPAGGIRVYELRETAEA
jgi:class 3 adenylate cyclase